MYICMTGEVTEVRSQLQLVKADRDRLSQELKKAEQACLVFNTEAISEKEATLRRAKTYAEVRSRPSTLLDVYLELFRFVSMLLSVYISSIMQTYSYSYSIHTIHIHIHNTYTIINIIERSRSIAISRRGVGSRQPNIEEQHRQVHGF